MTDEQNPPLDPQFEQDAMLVRAYLSGDKTALAAIYDRYGTTLFDTAAAMCGSRDDASDMVQDVFVLAAERLGQLRDPTRLKAWLFAILRNEVYRRSRRRTRTVVTDFSAPERDVMLPPSQAETDVVDDEIDFTDVAELVRGAARGLDARDQLVLELSVRQGLSGTDLADALGVSAQQSYGLVHRMRDRTERSLGAFCVARKGRRECSELDALLSGWDGDFTVLLRKRVARHIETCSTCERTRRRFAPLALVGAAPAFAAPIELRDRIIAQLDLLHPSSVATEGVSPSTEFSSSNGFPLLEQAARSTRRLAMVLGGAAAGLLVGLSALWISRSNEPPVAAGPPPLSISNQGDEPPEQPSLATDISSTTSSTAPTTVATKSASATTEPVTEATTTMRVTSTTRPATASPTEGEDLAPTTSQPAAPATTTTTTATTTTTTTTTIPTVATTTTTIPTVTPTTTTTVANRSPMITSLSACRIDNGSESGEDYRVVVSVSDPDGDSIELLTGLVFGGQFASITPDTRTVQGSGTTTFTVTVIQSNAAVTIIATDGQAGTDQSIDVGVDHVFTTCPS